MVNCHQRPFHPLPTRERAMYCDGILKIVSTIEGRDLNDVIAKADSVGVTAIGFNGRVFVRGVVQDPADVYDTVARRWPPARH